jgi:CelD/BcsL family acetyltransferase involved in cellulose biosynthesis
MRSWQRSFVLNLRNPPTTPSTRHSDTATIRLPESAGSGSLVRLELEDRRWLDLVHAAPQALPFHHPAWTNVIVEAYGYRAFVLGFVSAPDGDDVTAGVPVIEVRLPVIGSKWVSLPFTDYCPPLARGVLPRDFADALAHARHSAGVRGLEIRDCIAGRGVDHAPAGVRHTLELHGDTGAVLETFKRSQVRRNITRAQREGVTVRRSTSANDVIDTFYALHAQTRRRLGVPVQPRRFFRAIGDRIIEPGLGFVMIASHDGRPLAAAVFLHWNRTVFYKYGASDSDAWSLRPNHLLFWEAIRWSAENGYRLFDFGRSDVAQQGLREFKNGWGTKEEPLTYSIIRDRRKMAAEGGRVAGWASAGGGAIIRRSPPWVARLVGEALYKYSA